MSVYTPSVWQVLTSTHASLFMNLEYQADFGPPPPGISQRTDGIALVKHANQLGIPVDAWITFPVADGTFADEQNADLVYRAVQDFHAWTIQHQLRVRETLLDLEIPIGYQAVAQAAAGHLGDLEQLMKANIDPAGQCRAMAIYRDTISWAHAHGMRITGTPIPFALDDIQDGNMGLEDALDTVAFPPFGYDELYLQAYRSNFVDPGNIIDLGSGYVARYYKEMQHYFGSIGQVGLGDTGIAPYDKLSTLVDDVRMLAALGASKILIFDLDGTVKPFGAAGLRSVIEAGHHPLTPAQLAAAEQQTTQGVTARQMFAALDQAANTLTLAVTATEGHPQRPNAYPNGCGNLDAGR
jgi:hypothetical protein